MAAKDDWIEDLRRWCFEAPMAEVDALMAGVSAAEGVFASPSSDGASHGEAAPGGDTMRCARDGDAERAPLRDI